MRGVERTVLLPLLETIIVGHDRAIKGPLEISLGVRRAEEMPAWTDFAQRVERLAVGGHIDALQQYAEHAGLVGVHDELLVAHRKAALEPAGRVQHEVDAGKRRRLQRIRRLVGGLRIRDLRGTQGAAAAKRHAEPPRQRADRVDDQAGLRRAEGRRA